MCSIYSFCWKLKTNQIYHTTVLLTNYISITIYILMIYIHDYTDIHTRLYIYIHDYLLYFSHTHQCSTTLHFHSKYFTSVSNKCERRTVSFYNLIKLQLIKKNNMHASLYSSIPFKIRTFSRLMIHPKLPNITNSMLNINK